MSCTSLVNNLRKKYGDWRKYFTPIRGNNNNVEIENNSTISIRWDVEGNNNSIAIGSNCFISNLKIFVRGDYHKIKIADNVIIEGGELWVEDLETSILIDEHTSIVSAHLAVTEPGRKIIIGRDCMLSRGIEIRTGDSHAIINAGTDIKINNAADVIIGDHVWIGSDVKILKGVKISTNSIIGTGSIVTKSIPANSVAAGIPAKVIRENANWKRARY